MYLVLFITDYRKEHDFRAHKVFSTKEAAIEEAKKFTNPPPDIYQDDDDEEGDDGGATTTFEWEYTCPSTPRLFEGKCKVPSYSEKGRAYEGGAVANMSWTPVVTVVEVGIGDEATCSSSSSRGGDLEKGESATGGDDGGDKGKESGKDEEDDGNKKRKAE